MKIVGNISGNFKEEDKICEKKINLYKKLSKKFLLKIKKDNLESDSNKKTYQNYNYSSDDLSDYEQLLKSFRVTKSDFKSNIQSFSLENSGNLNMQTSNKTTINWINFKFSKLKLKKDFKEKPFDNHIGKNHL